VSFSNPSDSTPKTLAKKVRWSTKASSLPFGIGSLLDLLQAGLGAANPIARIIDLVLIHRDRPRNFFRSCHHLPAEFHGFRAFDRELPMMPETVERIKHRLGFHSAHSTAAHRVVKHSVAILPWAIVLLIGHVVQHGGVPIFPFKRSAH